MKKFSNKILIIILLALAVIFIATKLFRDPTRQSNLNVDVLVFDTTRIDRIEVQRDTHAVIELRRQGDEWLVSHREVTSRAERAIIRNVLRSLSSLTPDRIVTRNADKWANYHVDDSLSIAVKTFSGNALLKDIFIGKQSGGKTYIRLGNQDEVYTVETYLRSTFDKDFSGWRDPSVLRIQRDQVQRITFHYPADSGFVIEKKDGTWMINANKADSAAVEKYLSALRSKDHREFIDDFQPKTDPDVTITFSGQNGDQVLKAWNTAFYEWVYNSSHQPEVYFADKKMNLARDILKGRQTFEPKEADSR